MIARTAKRPGDARHRVGAQPRNAFIPIEPDGLGIERRLEASWQWPEARECDLGQARVRAIQRIDARVDRLVILHEPVEPPALPEPGEMNMAIEERNARAVGTEPEIFEVVAVARIREFRVDSQAIGQVSPVRQCRQTSIAAREIVAGQVVGVELAAAALGQVTVFGAETETAPREQEWRQGQVVVRRKIEVIGNADLESALVGIAERRKQESGLACIAHRKGDHGRVEDRDSLEVDPDVAARALLRFLVDVDRRGPQLPVGIARRAGREAHFLELELAVRGHLQ